MIAHATQARSGIRDRLGGLLRYLAGPGRFNEHTDQRIVAANVAMADPTGLDITEPGVPDELAADMQRPADIFGTDLPAGKDRYVYHVPVTLHHDDGQLSDEQWAYVARSLADKLGFTETAEQASVRWLAVHHGTTVDGLDHIHFVAYLAREDGEQVDMHGDYRKLGQLRQEMETDPTLGLTVQTKHTDAGRSSAAPASLARAARTGRDQPDRDELERRVRAAVAGASCEGEWVRAMRRDGLLVAPRYATGAQDEVVGYSVGLRAEPGEQTVFHGGGKLAKDLSLTAIRHRWDGHNPAQALPAWSRKAGRGVLAARIGQHANQATTEQEFVTNLRADGLLVLPRYDEADQASVIGYRAAQAPQHGTIDQPVFYTDTELAAPLSRLRQHWPASDGETAAVWSARAARGHVAQLLRATRAEAVGETDWIASVRETGLKLLPRHDGTDRDTVVGYTAILGAGDGTEVAARDDQLPDDLRLDQLRTAWPATANTTAAARAAWAQRPHTERQAEAIDAVTTAANQFQQLTAGLDHHDPAWAQTAREHAELLATVADQLPTQQARTAAHRAVRALGHAAELPNGQQRGTSSQASHTMRAMCRAMIGARIMSHGGVQAWMYLLLTVARAAQQVQHTRTAAAAAATARHAREASDHALHARQIIQPRDTAADEINAALANQRTRPGVDGPARPPRSQPQPHQRGGRDDHHSR